MAVRIILGISFVMILPIMYGMLRHYGNPEGNQIFGATIGKEHMQEEIIHNIQKRYKKELNWYALIALAIWVGSFFIPYLSIFYTVQMFWLLFVAAGIEIPFMKANSQVKRVKLERGWGKEFVTEVLVDTEVAKQQERIVAKQWYVAAGVLSILPLVGYGVQSMRGNATGYDLLLCGSLVLAVMVFLVGGLWMQRIRYGVVSNDSKINQAVARAKRYHWAKGMAGAALITAVYNIVFTVEYGMQFQKEERIMIETFVYLFLLLGWLYYIVCQVYRVKVRLLGEDQSVVVDEDDHWIYGLFYYNKNDSSFAVEKRVGIGTTVNMARPAAKVGAVIVALLLLLIPGSCILLIGDEFSTVELSLTEKAVECKQFEGTYSVALADIEKVELIAELPHTSKKAGTAMDNIYRGTFRVEGYGSCKLCLVPDNRSFLVINKKDGSCYILSDERDENTKKVYDKLLLQLQEL